MSEVEAEFRIGDRVRLSAARLKLKGIRRGGYQGLVVGIRGGLIPTVTVVFDGNKKPTKLHAKYLVLDRDG